MSQLPLEQKINTTKPSKEQLAECLKELCLVTNSRVEWIEPLLNGTGNSYHMLLNTALHL